MINISFTHNGTTYHRITKDIARKAYNAGKTVLLAPCKMNPNSPWFIPHGIRKNKNVNSTFDKLVDIFSYHNCNGELGHYAAFYIAQ